MKVTETTPTVTPPPRSFTLEVSEDELKYIRLRSGRAGHKEDRDAGVPVGTGERIFVAARDVIGPNPSRIGNTITSRGGCS